MYCKYVWVFWHKEKAKDQLVVRIIIIDVIRWNLPLKFREGSSQTVVFSNRSIKMLWISSPDLLSVPMYLSALDVELHRYWDVSTFYFHKAGPFQFSLKQALRSSLVFSFLVFGGSHSGKPLMIYGWCSNVIRLS